jgi:transforming growth factor-beta-induced protein
MLCQILLTSLCLTSANAQPNVVEIAANSQEFTTLVAAVTAADLATTLTSEGPFTIFAPSNSAFGRIDGNVLNTLLNEPGTPALKQILLHHVVLGNVTADQLQDQDVLTTAAGTTLTVTIVNGRVLIDDAAVTQANITGSNGVIHKIDRVILPPNSQPNVVEIAANSPEFTTLVAAVKAADLANALTTEGPFTIFAPSNSAFDRIDKSTLTSLLNEPGTSALKQILLHHVVAGNVSADQLKDQDVLTTLAGTTLSVTIVNNRVLINDAVVTHANISGSNGVIHKIDRVVLPPI